MPILLTALVVRGETSKYAQLDLSYVIEIQHNLSMLLTFIMQATFHTNWKLQCFILNSPPQQLRGS